MRKAAVASVAIHFGLIAGVWAFIEWKPTEDIGAESVSVDIVSMDAVSTEPSEVITEANKTLISAGAETESMSVPEIAETDAVAAEPVEVAEAEAAKTVSPVAAALLEVVGPSDELTSAQVMAATAQTIAPVEAAMPQQVDSAAIAVVDNTVPSRSDPLEVARTASIGELTPEPPVQQMPQVLLKPVEAVQPVDTASLASVIEEDMQVVPIPKPRIFRKPLDAKTEPGKEPPQEPPRKQTEPTKKTPSKEKPQDKPPSKQASLGNGGAADADTKASKKSGGGQGKTDDGGSAAASKYPGLVQAKVTRAVKRPPKADGKSGEAQVSFVVAANGSVGNVALARSSGNATLDKAALAAVSRAAPFPPIPATAGRSSWSFTVPIYFNR